MIDQAAAITIARERAAERGWPFSEPLEIRVRRSWLGRPILRYEIGTNAGNRGTKASFVVDAETGEIVRAGYIAR